MTTSNEVIKLIKGLSLADRLKIVEEILKSIREEEAFRKEGLPIKEEEVNGPAILARAGIFDEAEAKVFESAIAESRKIDEDEW